MLGISVRRNSDDDIQVTSEVGNQLLELAGGCACLSHQSNNTVPFGRVYCVC